MMVTLKFKTTIRCLCIKKRQSYTHCSYFLVNTDIKLYHSWQCIDQILHIFSLWHTSDFIMLMILP